MAFGGSKKRTTMGRRIKDMQKKEAELYSLIRRSDTPNQVQVPFFSGTGGSSDQGGTGSNFLPTAGGTMIGPIAFFPRVATIATGAIDISSTTDEYTSRIIIAAQTGTTDDLDTITGANHAGQILILQAVATHTITIKHGADNFRSATGADIVLQSQDNIMLIFDAIANEWTNLSPVSDTTASGSGANTALSNLSAVQINQTLIPDTSVTYDLGSGSDN